MANLIDISFFSGDILVAQRSQLSVQETLNRFITTYETEYLQKVLGYSLWKDFIAGINAPVPDQKWIDLLIGAEYTAPDGTLKKWIGFTNTNVNPGNIGDTSLLTFVAGVADGPTVGETLFTNTKLLNRTFYIERRMFGTMIEGTDYLRVNSDGVTLNPNGNSIKLLQPGDSFQPNEIFIFHMTGYVTISSSTTVNISPIANYVYWQYRQKTSTLTTGTGENVAQNENSDMISPARKMIDAWDQMVSWNYDLWQFLYVNATAYGLTQADFWTSYFQVRGYVNAFKKADYFNMGYKVNDFDL